MAAADTSREDDELSEAKEEFDRCQEASSENYNEGLDDLRFARLGEQWPEKMRHQRELDGRPCLTINRLPAFIRQVVNDARQNKPAIAVHPVDNGADPETAEVFSGLIRHIEQSSDADVAYDTALDFAVTCGFGYFRINTRYTSDDSFEQDICVERVANPFSVFGDPDSTAADSSDWNIAFQLDQMTERAFKARWKGADPVSFGNMPAVNRNRTSDDLVTVAARWRREEVRRSIVALSDGQVVDLALFEANREMFDALGVTVVGRPRDIPSFKVTQTLLSGADVLEEIDWAGKYIPIVPVYGEEVNVEGRRYFRSLVRDAKDPQRMFNFWRTASTELVALAPKAPFIGPVGAFTTDAAKWATANTQTHAYLEYDTTDERGQPIPAAPQRQPFTGVPAGALQEALNASDDMKAILGIYDASLGARSNETSGRAIMARQREGDVSTFHYIDNLSRAIRHAGRIMLDLIPKVYATPRMIRTLGPDGSAQAVKIGPRPDMQTEGAQADQAMEAAGPAALTPEQEQAEKLSRVFDVAAGKYDVTVTAGPSFTSRREEAATQMIELIRAYPAAAPLIGDLLARNLDWPGADEIAERLQTMLPAQIQGGNPEMEQAKQVMGQMAQALEAAKREVEALKTDRSLEARKVDVDAFNAETNRLKAVVGKDGAPYDIGQMAGLVAASLQYIQQSPDILALMQSGATPEQLMAALAGQQQQPPQAA